MHISPTPPTNAADERPPAGELLTVQEAAVGYGICPRLIARWVASGWIATMEVGSRRLIVRSALHKMVVIRRAT